MSLADEPRLDAQISMLVRVGSGKLGVELKPMRN
jgi:hypothetical protein